MTDEITLEEDTKPYYLRIVKYFLNHPAIAGSFIYILFSIAGVIYSWVLYRQFQINIFDYSEANDFLLIAFKNPVGYFSMTKNFLIGFSIPVFIGLIMLLVYKNRLSLSLKDLFCLFVDAMIFRFSIIVYLVMFFFFVPISNAISARNIIHNNGSSINVLYEEGKQGSTSVVKKLKSSLIGSTEKFMFFYNPSDNNTVVIPITRIISITTDKKGLGGKPDLLTNGPAK
jgi:hypothetical protein